MPLTLTSRTIRHPSSLILGVSADSVEYKDVAIRLCACHPLRPCHSAGPANVLDDDLLTEGLAHVLGHDTAEHIRWTARSERNHHGNGTGGPALRSSGVGQSRDKTKEGPKDGKFDELCKHCPFRS